MEEGAPSSSSRPPLHRPPAADIESFTLASIPPSPLTYIIQVPKDHIYRVPPPENTRLAEQYRAQHSALRRDRAPCLKFLLHILCVVIAIAISLLAAAVIFYIIVRPTIPTFYIKYIVATASSTYEIEMEMKNPSLKMGYSIQKGGGGSATLIYHEKVVAEGLPPHFYLGAKQNKTLKMTLSGKRKDILKETDEGRKGHKEATQLQLAMKMPMMVGIGSLRLWTMKMIVECTVRSKHLESRTSILSQECKARVKF